MLIHVIKKMKSKKFQVITIYWLIIFKGYINVNFIAIICVQLCQMSTKELNDWWMNLYKLSWKYWIN